MPWWTAYPRLLQGMCQDSRWLYLKHEFGRADRHMLGNILFINISRKLTESLAFFQAPMQTNCNAIPMQTDCSSYPGTSVATSSNHSTEYFRTSRVSTRNITNPRQLSKRFVFFKTCGCLFNFIYFIAKEENSREIPICRGF
jgi:hypothetical protein